MNTKGKAGRAADAVRYGALLTLSGLALAASLMTRTGAQGPGGPPPGGFGQGPGRFGGRMPFVIGTVRGGDREAGVLTVSLPFGGQDQAVRVTRETRYATQATVKVSDLQVGDQVQVQGVPTAITASSLAVGQMPDFLLPGGFGGRARGGAAAPGSRGTRAQAMAFATGKVTSTAPLTLSIGDGISIVLKTASDAKVTRISDATLANLKVGDRIMAVGQAGEDGTFTATGIGINMTMGAGPGGFGGPDGFGRPGGRGPGGPGGPPPGGPEGPGGPPPGGPGEPPPGDGAP